jgi:hypothetical protein
MKHTIIISLFGVLSVLILVSIGISGYLRILPVALVALVIAGSIIIYSLQRKDKAGRQDIGDYDSKLKDAYIRNRNLGILLLISPVVYYIEKWESLDALHTGLLAVPVALGSLFLAISLRQERARNRESEAKNGRT